MRTATVAAVSVCRRTRTLSVSSPLSSTQALNGEIEGPVWRIRLCTWSWMNFSDAEHHAAEAAPLSVDMLGRRIDDAIRAERERRL